MTKDSQDWADYLIGMASPFDMFNSKADFIDYIYIGFDLDSLISLVMSLEEMQEIVETFEKAL